MTRSADEGRWLATLVDAWLLGVESAHVIALRAARIAAAGPTAGPELWLMVAEKWQAADELGTGFLRRPAKGPVGVARRSISHYRRKVAANSGRLNQG